MNNIEDFIDKLIADRNLPGVTDDVRVELKADLTQRLMNQIDRAAINALSEEQAIELSNKMDDPNFGPDQISAFLVSSGIDLQQVALETMVKFRSFYLGEKAF